MNFPAIKAEHRTAGRGWIAALGLVLFSAFYTQGMVPYQSLLRDVGFDYYQKILPREQVSAPVRIVTIDERSLERFGQWPWPRSLTARLIEKINQHNPAAIGINILMPEPDRSSPCRVVSSISGVDSQLLEQVCSLPDPDELLAQQLFSSRVVLGIVGLLDADGRTDFQSPQISAENPDFVDRLMRFPSAIGNLPGLEFAASGIALLDTDASSEVVRRVPLLAQVGNGIMPALSMELLRVALDIPEYSVGMDGQRISSLGLGDVVVPTDPDAQLWIHYSPQSNNRYISAADVLDDSIDTASLQSRLVIIGVSAAGLSQFPTTALGETVPGSEIHAQAIENIFDGTVLQRPAWGVWLEGSLVLVLGLVVLLLLPMLGAAYQIPVLLTGVFGTLYGGFYAFSEHLLLIDVATPTLAFLALYFLMLTDSFIREEAQVKALAEDLQQRREEAAKTQGEMEAAKRFQMSIVPNSYEVFSAEPRIDLAASMDPARDVGGDLYDFFYLDEHRIFIGLGDVCGKGVQASLFMVISKTLMKSIVSRADSFEQDLAEVITRLNTEIGRDNTEMLFVTMFAGILDLRTGELVYCNAGHEPPAILKMNGEPAYLDKKSGPPVGALDEFDYQAFTYQLYPDEYLCVFTDGLTEATNAAQELFSQSRLIESLGKVEDAESLIKLERVIGEINEFVGDSEPADDLTMMILRWNGPSQALGE